MNIARYCSILEGRAMLADVTTVCFVGAGSAVFTRQLLRDLLDFADLGPLELVMHDVDERRLELAEGLGRIAVERHGRPATVRAQADRAAALSGADFVINAVNIGGHAATVTDFEIPARYGLRQTIADTLGVGGVFRGLRTFGFLDSLAADMRVECPDAWLLNYTNPMAMNLQYLAQRHPEIKALGLCHSVFWTVHDLCELIDVPMEEVEFHSAGVNHQAWVLGWERDGHSLYPLLDERIAADPELLRRVRVDMYRRLGYYPTETSEHSSEYVAWYLHDDAEIERLRIPVGDYLQISADNVKDIEAVIPQVAAGTYVEPDEEATEYAPQVIHSMVTGRPRTIQVTVANADLIENLPKDSGVEVPCVIDAAGARPVAVGALPTQCAALNRQFLSVVELTVRAAIERRPEFIRHAMMVDPNTSATLSVDAIWRLADDMVAAHADRLPEELRVPLAQSIGTT
jgi:alpha-galactosidase